MDTTFINGTVVEAAWLNEANRDTYKDLPNVKNDPYSAVGDGVADDTAAVTAAVAFAFTNNTPLNWPSGTYLTTANIPNFHAVRHTGAGVVKRGTDLFYVTPKEGNENSIYVSSSGDDANDGLATTQPLATTQAAFDVLTIRGFVDGTWRIKHAAGTYSGSAKSARLGNANDSPTLPDVDYYKNNGVVTKNYVIIEGPDVGYDPLANPTPVPTAIFDGGSSAAIGIQLAGQVRVLFKNLKFINYSGSTSSAGISGVGAWIRTENVHGNANAYDMISYQGRLEVKGGTLSNATQAAIRSQFLNKHEIGEQAAGGVPGQGPFITDAAIGLQIQEGATGHSDAVNYTNCTNGIYLAVNARCNYTGSVFTNCSIGVRSLQGYSFALSATFTGCTENKVHQMYAVDGIRDQYSNSGLACNYLNDINVHTGHTTNEIVLTKTLAAGDWGPVISGVRKPQHFEFEFFGTSSGTAGTKQHKIRLGFTVIGSITLAAATVGDWRVRGSLYFMATGTQRGFIELITHLGASTLVDCDSIFFNTKDLSWDVTYEQQLTNAADTITTLGGHIKSWG